MIPYADRAIASIVSGTLAAANVEPQPLWLPIVVALASGGAIASLLSFARWFITYRAGKTNNFAEILRDQHEIQDQLNKATTRTGAQRGLVLCMSNGGGLPRRGANLYVTATFESIGGAGVPVVSDSWQRRQVDCDYSAALLPMLETGRLKLHIDDLDPDSDLALTWAAGNIKLGRLFEVGQIGSEYYFLSFAYTSDAPLHIDQDDELRGAVSIISRLLKKGSSYY